MSVNVSYSNQSYNCLTGPYQVAMVIFTITKILLILPLCILVLFVGHQRWRQRSPGATLSHFDILSYHLVTIEILNVIRAILNSWITYADVPSVRIAFKIAFSVSFPGQLFYQCLTSIDRYLAVVHPIIYLRLRNRNAVQIIYISSGFALLLCAAVFVVFYERALELTLIPVFSVLVLSLIVVSFCSLSVLHALKRPGPGEGGGADQFKQRAFKTTMAILMVLLLWFVGILVGYAVGISGAVVDQCLPSSIGAFFSLPGSLVIPLLFLHRVRKLPCCLYNSE
ncbi:unnamed protein product [Pleuronectes platessa]|uniref:G-protein coupled receptors family 1 profile domain-containing protein n=1 Tax=Pleuronectes platessa TaxID=8262 RepID=A0A9N7U453_PLEPL|nr:unnamed protein product [Pleuronectes platessa]